MSCKAFTSVQKYEKGNLWHFKHFAESCFVLPLQRHGYGAALLCGGRELENGFISGIFPSSSNTIAPNYRNQGNLGWSTITAEQAATL